MNIKLILISTAIIITSLFSQPDTVIFSSEKVGLITLTNNIDSINYFPQESPPNPFSPSMETYAVRIAAWDTSSLSIAVKDALQNTKVVYIWHKIKPGAYKFYWWENLNYLPSGVYSIETTINNKTTTKKAIIVK
ncbi:MAG: hypothetical protein L0Y79_07340 [Chlorobi bacterium]|nr:hypothetical protein [Chlorobiota bacterium]MCI0715989.1 hypothetical protein [Chlorobiota bacterium]